MSIDKEREGEVNSFDNLPITRPGNCPYHPLIRKFVRVPGMNVFVCPEKDHGGPKGHNVDRLPGATNYDK